MCVKRVTAGLMIALAATACGSAGAADPPTSTEQTLDAIHRVGETLEEVAAHVELVVLARATDSAWTEAPPGTQPQDEEAIERALPDDGTAFEDSFVYHWRDYEVVEVLAGEYAHDTLRYGGIVDRATAGETYVLFVSVLPDREGKPAKTVQDFTGGVPPYHLMPEQLLVSTDATIYPTLPPALTLAELRRRVSA